MKISKMKFLLRALAIVLIAGAVALSVSAAPNSPAARKVARSASGSQGARARSAAPSGARARSATGSAARSGGRTARSARASTTRTARRATARGLKMSAMSSVSPKVEKVNDSACPVGQVLKKSVDAESLEGKVFVAPDKACTEPENAQEVKWSDQLGIPVPLSWIKSEEAIVYQCEPNFIQRSAPSGKTYCLDAEQLCPINEDLLRVIKDKTAVLVDLEYKEACIIPELTGFRIINAGESIIMLECPYNTYSASINGANPDHHQVCRSCPEGFITLNPGAAHPDVCIKRCEFGYAANENTGVCELCSYAAEYDEKSFACNCKPGYHGNGIGDQGCAICAEGTYCKNGFNSERVDITAGEYAPFKGMSEPEKCPDGLASTGSSCDCGDLLKEFDPSSKSCINAWCTEGKMLENGQCVPCREGYICTEQNM